MCEYKWRYLHGNGVSIIQGKKIPISRIRTGWFGRFAFFLFSLSHLTRGQSEGPFASIGSAAVDVYVL